MAAGPDMGAVSPITISVSVTPGALGWAGGRPGRQRNGRERDEPGADEARH